MRFSFSLPPLVAILLLAFVWVIVFVLLLWFFLPGGRQPDETEREQGDGPRAPRRTPPPTDNRHRNTSNQNVSKRNTSDADPSTLPRPRIRAVPAETPEDERPNARDAFEEYDRSGRRRDDSDF